MAITAWGSIFNVFKSLFRSPNERTKPSKTEILPLKDVAKLPSPQPLNSPVEDIGIENPAHDEAAAEPNLMSPDVGIEETAEETLILEGEVEPNFVSQTAAFKEVVIESLDEVETTPPIENTQIVAFKEVVIESLDEVETTSLIENTQTAAFKEVVIESLDEVETTSLIENTQTAAFKEVVIESLDEAETTPLIENTQTAAFKEVVIESLDEAETTPLIENTQIVEFKEVVIESLDEAETTPLIENTQTVEFKEVVLENLQEVETTPLIENTQNTEIKEIVVENLREVETAIAAIISQKTDIEEIKTESPIISSDQPDLVTLEEEMNTVEQYLASEKQRLGENFDYLLDIEQDALNQKIPPVIIQTLAKNAVKHGVQEVSEKGYVHIQSFVHDGFLTIEIKNSGQLKNEDPLVNTAFENGIYIENTIKRLAQLFGENGFFSIENGSENEVVATVCVPVV